MKQWTKKKEGAKLFQRVGLYILFWMFVFERDGKVLDCSSGTNIHIPSYTDMLQV